jgi:hypothetical protein
VNSGKFTGGRNLEDTIVKTNIEAAAEIARQVRLRDIGGIVVCDFIDMSTEHARTKVIDTLKAGLEKDRTRTTIQSFSALGLLEFTRKRVGKDLSGQLRGPCPTCIGLGTVMSPESVAIEAFRDIRKYGHEHTNGSAHKPIEIVSAPTVGAQIEYWYEDELAGLERELQTTIAVRVDASLHPERTRILSLPDEATAKAPPANLRVGDELEVDLVHARLPIATSALAIIGDRLVEVENASNAVGETIKIKVIDIDDEGTILAEPRHVIADQTQVDRKRRRRGGRGRAKPLTLAEQEEQLRELAEEAAKGAGARPALGISTTAEAEAEEAEDREHPQLTPPLATVTPLHAVPDYAAVDPNGEGRAFASYGGPAEGDGRRRRRRRRRRRGAGEAPGTAALTAVPGAPSGAPVAPGDAEDEFEDDVEATEPGEAVASATVAPGLEGDGAVRRRRRRRRRRGRGGVAAEGAIAETADGAPDAATGRGRGTVPDRHIFRVDGTGSAEPTGETAPPEPNRAIARVDRKAAPVAVEAPPPSLTVPEETAKVAKPTRRRRKADDVEATPQLALAPAPVAEPESEPAAEVPAPRRRGRPRKVAIEPSAAPVAVATPEPVPAPAPVAAAPEPEKPKRGRNPKAAAPEPEVVKAEPAPARRAAAKKPAAKKAKAVAKKAPARKSTAPAARSKAAAPAARKKAAATSTRKKTR